MNEFAVCVWLVIGGALLRVGWECVGRTFAWIGDRLSSRARRKALVERDRTDH